MMTIYSKPLIIVIAAVLKAKTAGSLSRMVLFGCKGGKGESIKSAVVGASQFSIRLRITVRPVCSSLIISYRIELFCIVCVLHKHAQLPDYREINKNGTCQM